MKENISKVVVIKQLERKLKTNDTANSCTKENTIIACYIYDKQWKSHKINDYNNEKYNYYALDAILG